MVCWVFSRTKRQTYFKNKRNKTQVSQSKGLWQREGAGSQDFKSSGSFGDRKGTFSVIDGISGFDQDLQKTKKLKIKKKERAREGKSRRRCRRKMNPFQSLENVDFRLNGSLAEFQKNKIKSQEFGCTS